MAHRVDDVVDSEFVRLSGEWNGVIRVVGVLPAITHV